MTTEIPDVAVEAAAEAMAGELGIDWSDDAADKDEARRMVRIALTAGLAAIKEAKRISSEPCDAEIHSWERFTPDQVDSYWIRCSRVGPHDDHEDSDTGLTWPRDEHQEEPHT